MGSIQATDLSVTLGNHVVLSQLNFEFSAGEKVFLVGPSGCGKTTLLRTIGGFIRPSQGIIKLDGKDVLEVPPHHRGAPMVFQNYALWPHMTVLENVSFALSSGGASRSQSLSRAQEALKVVGLVSHSSKKPDELSGGQQQRVALARALVLRPKIILLDEPFSNLDHHLRVEMRSELQRLQREFEFTTVFVTHDREEALTLADRILMLDRGQIIQFAAPREFYSKPANLLSASFMGEANFFEGKIREIGTKIQVETPLGLLSGCGSKELKINQSVLAMVRPENISLARLEESQFTLTSKVKSLLFKGPSVELITSLDGLEIKSHHPSETALPINSEVRLSFNPDSIWIMPR